MRACAASSRVVSAGATRSGRGRGDGVVGVGIPFRVCLGKPSGSRGVSGETARASRQGEDQGRCGRRVTGRLHLQPSGAAAWRRSSRRQSARAPPVAFCRAGGARLVMFRGLWSRWNGGLDVTSPVDIPHRAHRGWGADPPDRTHQPGATARRGRDNPTTHTRHRRTTTHPAAPLRQRPRCVYGVQTSHPMLLAQTDRD